MTSIKKLAASFWRVLKRRATGLVSTAPAPTLVRHSSDPAFVEQQPLQGPSRHACGNYLAATGRLVAAIFISILVLAAPQSLRAAEGWAIQPLVLPGDVIDGKTIVNVLPLVDIDEDGTAVFVADYTDAEHPDANDPGRGIFTQDRVVVVVGGAPVLKNPAFLLESP